MDLFVQTHGPMVPQAPWEAPVVSVFSRSLNMLHPSGLLIGVVAFPEQMGPYSLLAPDLFRSDLAPAAQRSRGVTCVKTDAELRIANFRLQLSSSLPWDGRLPSTLVGALSDTKVVHSDLVAALEFAGAEDGLREIVVAAPSATIFGQRAKEILDRTAIVRRDGSERLRGLSSLVGLGIGFTPSGDDFLSGVCLARELIGPAGIELDREEIGSALGKTNDAGRTLLTGVLEGQFPAYLLAFAHRIVEAGRAGRAHAQDARRAVADAVAAAAVHGETSGTDAVTGFTWYIDFHNRRPQFI